MANEVLVNYDNADTVYFVRFNESGQVAVSDGSSFENWGAGGNDADDYDVSLSPVGSAPAHIGHFDAGSNIAAGRYFLVGFLREGASPADGDPRIAESDRPLIWDGTKELFAPSLSAAKAFKSLVNKAIQTKSTGAIVFFDDDGVTPILTHTPTDGESTITRTPG